VSLSLLTRNFTEKLDMIMDDDLQLLFYGSKASFAQFDPAFTLTGEGVGTYQGWHFVDNLRGANTLLKGI
jgi:hypothetical protein